MKKSYKIFMLLMVFGLASLLAMNSAYSKCGTSVTAGQYTYCVYGGAGYGNTQFELDVSLFGEWWDLGQGDSTDGLGTDRGTHIDDTTASWLSYYSGSCHYMNGGVMNWGNAGVDGCIADNKPEEGPMVATVDDKKADNSTAFFVIACVNKYEGAPSPTYDFDAAAPVGMVMTELPSITIDSSDTGTPGQVGLTLSWAAPTAGFYNSTAACAWADVLQAYEVYYYQGTSAPTTRDPADWTAVPDTDGNAADLTASVAIPDPAGAGESSWLALRLAWDSGFKTHWVGPNSSQVAGPTAAGGFETVSANLGGKAKKNIRIDWVTNAEFNVAGFNVLRAENPDGPYTAVNSGLIAATGVGGAGDSYTYVDRIEGMHGKFTYYYKVEMVGSGEAPNVLSEAMTVTLKAPKKPKGR